MSGCSPHRSTWSELTTTRLYDILKLRTDVFYAEQKVDDLELDGRDREPGTVHFYIPDDVGVASYLRVLRSVDPEFREARVIVGRVVTRSDRRGHGLARILLDAAVREFGGEPMLLHAQSYIAGFYLSGGFEPFGDEFVEAGIPHIGMYRPAR